MSTAASTPDPPGGRIERDERGEPTGVLVETAWTAAHTASLVGYDDPDRWGELIEARALGLLAEGITAVHDAACPPEAEAVYRALAAAGRLPLSVLVMPHGPILGGPDLGRLDRGPVTGEGDEWLRVGPVKLFADGGVDLDIDAHFGDVHVDRRGGFPDTAAQAAAAVQRGYGLAIHAMGNRALRSAIDAWRIATADREPAHPCRIEHVSLAGIDEVAAMRDLGITGVVQPAFVDLIGQTVGNFRFDDATWLPFADLLAAGVPLAASSDGPCQFTDPLLSTFHGVTRLTRGGVEVGPDQAVPFLEWLRLYTAGAAEAGGQADERGRLRPGLVADFVVLDGDVEVASRSADAVVVAETWVAGERVHSA